MDEALDFDIKICFNHILSYILGLKSKLAARDKNDQQGFKTINHHGFIKLHSVCRLLKPCVSQLER